MDEGKFTPANIAKMEDSGIKNVVPEKPADLAAQKAAFASEASFVVPPEMFQKIGLPEYQQFSLKSQLELTLALRNIGLEADNKRDGAIRKLGENVNTLAARGKENLGKVADLARGLGEKAHSAFRSQAEKTADGIRQRGHVAAAKLHVGLAGGEGRGPKPNVMDVLRAERGTLQQQAEIKSKTFTLRRASGGFRTGGALLAPIR